MWTIYSSKIVYPAPLWKIVYLARAWKVEYPVHTRRIVCVLGSFMKGCVPCSQVKDCVLESFMKGFVPFSPVKDFVRNLLKEVFFFLDFLSWTFTVYRIAGKGETISLIHLYHIESDPRHLDISWVITAESSLLHIAINRARTHIAINRARTVCLWFASAIRKPLSYAPCCVPSLIVKDCIP